MQKNIKQYIMNRLYISLILKEITQIQLPVVRIILVVDCNTEISCLINLYCIVERNGVFVGSIQTFYVTLYNIFFKE